jgi:predicted hydrocarbon binding protein
MIPEAQQPKYFYPNKMGRIILLAMEEIIGRNGVNAVLNLAELQGLINNYPPNNLDLRFSFENLSRIMVTLEALYGIRGGRGLALRTGRASFKYGLREFGPILGITDLSFRLLPLQMKLKVGADAFAQAFNNFTDQNVSLEEDEQSLYWHIERCPLCWGRAADSPVCQLAAGTLQEALHWVSGGKYFEVEETGCIAMGDQACTFSILKQPID